MTNLGEYLSHRADEERKAASSAAHPNVRRIHIEMAEAYERQARKLAAEERRSVMSVVRMS
jgi:hypothetical protein